MLAQRADEICGKLLPLIDVAAHGAAPYRLAPGRGVPGGAGLDGGLIVGVGGGRLPGQNLHILHGGDEHGVAAQIDGLLHPGADVGVGARRDVIQPVGAALAGGVAGKLVHIGAGLEAEMLEQGKIGPLAQDGNVELPALQHHVMGEVVLVHRDADAVGGGGDLPRRVDDASVVLSLAAGCQHKQTVGQVVHCFFVHTNTLL